MMPMSLGIAEYSLAGCILVIAAALVGWLLHRGRKPSSLSPTPVWRVDRDGRVHVPSRKVVLRSRAPDPYAEALGKDGE